VSVFAAVLDGRHLWLAIERRPGSLALRAPDGTVLPLRSDADDRPDDHADHLAVRADLVDLLPPGEVEYDVVLVPDRGRPVDVWTPPLPSLDPMRVPPGPDGRQLAVRRGEDGRLRLVQRVAGPGVELARIDLDDDALVLHLPGASGDLLLLADLDDRPVLRLPLDGERATLRLDDLPPPDDVQTRVVVGSEDDWVPVRRARNDLANAGHAALLPVLADPQDGHALVRLRWRPGGALAARLHPERWQPDDAGPTELHRDRRRA
jgi:hypothetical protein